MADPTASAPPFVSVVDGCPAPFLSEADYPPSGGCTCPFATFWKLLISQRYCWSILWSISSQQLHRVLSPLPCTALGLFRWCAFFPAFCNEAHVLNGSLDFLFKKLPIANWIHVVGFALCSFLLISFAFLPLEKSHRHYLSIGLIIVTMMIQVAPGFTFSNGRLLIVASSFLS